MKKSSISVLSTITGAIFGADMAKRFLLHKTKEIQSMSDKHLALFLMMNQWVKVKQEGKSLITYFDKNGYKKIAIYGISYAGETLINELIGTSVVIAYGIDKNMNNTCFKGIDIMMLDAELPEVDAIVVTAITFFDEIEEKLSMRVTCPIISLEDILYEL